ncbi:MAG: TonB-dependent receptor [Myxococcales bacterium]|nr:TonB-dependent receptor [Myxococcales bacterium]
MKRFALSLSPLLLLLLLAPSVALAQGSRTGRIEGTIYDNEGNPLAGASVTVNSPTQIGGDKTDKTDDEGAFRFLGLTPGVFVVTVRAKGFIGAKRKGVRVWVSQTVTLDILLERDKTKPLPPASMPTSQPTSMSASQPTSQRVIRRVRRRRRPRGETYVIKAARPVIDVTRAQTGETLSNEFMENMPVLGRSYQGVVGASGNVTQNRNPSGAGAGNPAISGGAYFQNRYMIDGVDTTDPVTNTFSTNFNFDAMSDINVITGGKGPEFSDTPGGLINVVTRSGSNKLKLDSSIYYQNDALVIKRPEESGLNFTNLDFNLNIGGPIIKNKLWYFISTELNYNVSTLPPDRDGILPNHPSRKYFGVKALAKLTWQATNDHKFSLLFQTDPASISNTGQLITIEPDAETHQDQFGVIVSGIWDWRVSSKLFLKTQVSFKWNGLRVYPQSGNEDVSRISDTATAVASRNASTVTKDDRYRLTVGSSANYFVNKLAGNHELRGGFRFDHVQNPSEFQYTGNQVFQTRFGQPFALSRYFLDFDETSACDPTSPQYDAAKCRQGKLATSTSGNKLILFLQDTWRLPKLKRLRLIPGVALHAANSVNPDGRTVTSFLTATAHLNFALDVFGDGKTVLRGGYNQYVDMGFLSIPRFIGRAQIEQTCNWDPETRTYSLNCRVGGQIRTVGVPRPQFDADGNLSQDARFNPGALSPPRTHELVLGVAREWFDGFATGVDFQFRHFVNQWEDLETNVIWNEAGDNSQGFKSGKSEFIFDLETPDQAQRKYISLSFFARRFVGNWQLTASYTWSKSFGTVSEGFATTYLDRPRQSPFFDGPLPDDRRHVIKVTGFWRWKKIFTIGGNLWIGSGTPYDRLYFNSFFNDYADRRAVRGTDPRSLSTTADDVTLRTPWRLALNLKFVWRMTHLTKKLIGEAHKLELIGEIFNVFNLRTATRYEERNLEPGAPTQFGEIIDRQDPFRVRFGLRYRY